MGQRSTVITVLPMGKRVLTDSVANSCNSSFSNIGLQLDKAEWRKTAKQMLFNSKASG